MQKSSNSLTKDEQILISRAEDMLNSDRTVFSSFLTEREQAIIMPMVNRRDGDILFFGGYPDAERKMLGVFPFGTDASAFPIYPVTVQWNKSSSISHRDILGSLMALMITRDCIGDILVGETEAFIFLSKVAYDLTMTELVKIGSAGVKCKDGVNLSEMPEQRFDTSFDTVASMRLDNIIASITRKSRTQSVALIASGAVSVNAMPVESVSYSVKSGDKVSIRGYGKALVSEKGLSKKGRIHLEIRKYL